MLQTVSAPILWSAAFLLLAAHVQARDVPGKEFIDKAARGSVAEVELAKIAQSRATRPEIKQLAQHIQEDHQKAHEELRVLAAKKGVTLPDQPSAKHRRESERLAKLEGPKFDQAYLNAMVKDHRKDIREFENQAKDGKDEELKAWAAKTLPTLRDHLKMTQDLQLKLQQQKAASK